MSSEYKSFSERYGYTQPKLPQREMMDDDLRVGLWNAFYEIVEIKSWLRLHYSKGDLYREIFTNFLKKPYNEYDYHLSIESIKSVFLNGKWHEVYNLIEFIIVRYSYIIAQCNNILERENSAYRIVNKLVTEITSEQEITEIETALQIPFESVKSRLEKALALFSDREKPDYENSIKASISAVESIAKEIIGKEKSLNALTQELKLHPNLANALNELYNWTSKDGIRHGASRKHLSVNQDTARYMLVTCSAFVNYIVTQNPKKRPPGP